MRSGKHIANPGSALGEAIGASLEYAVDNLLENMAEQLGHYYLSSGVRKNKSGTRQKRLLLFDNYGNNYNIDGVIANELMQPIIIFETKYIRYTKHNRDKGSWICTAHSAIRRHYKSVRNSIAILAGNWSKSSLAMLQSYDVTIFLIPFDKICELLAEYGIDFNWEEKEREKAYNSWHTYSMLSSERRKDIGQEMVAVVAPQLTERISALLDDSIPREIEKVSVELTSNLGEVQFTEFNRVENAIDFLHSGDLDSIFLSTDSVSLFDPPPAMAE